MGVRVCHAWSSDIRIPSSTPFDVPLHARGWDITYATPNGPCVPSAAARGVHWTSLPMSRRMDPLGDARGLAQLTRTFLRERFDVVHTHNAKVGLVARLAATAARVPVVVHTVHGFPFHGDDDVARRAAYRLAERIANVRTDAILLQSEEDREILERLRVIDPSRIVFVGNGVDLRRFDPARFGDEIRRAHRLSLGVAEHDVLVTCAARLRTDKGIDELVRGALEARARDPRIRLALAGEPDREGLFAVDDALLRRARAAGVLVLGHVDDMPLLYAASDVVALPSWHEGLPRALVEGAALGKPLLATNVPGCREVLRAPMVGRLVPPRDPPAIRDALLELASSRDVFHRAAETNRAEATRRFDVARVAETIAELYERLLHASRASRSSR